MQPPTLENFNKQAEKGWTKIQQLWFGAVELDHCIWCRTKFPDGIVKKHPGETRFPLDAFFWFKPDFLIHAETTHGFNPEIITMYLHEINKKDA